MYIPFYEIEKVKGFLTKKIEERIVSTSILFDAVFSMLCSFLADVGVIRLFTFPKLSDEEKYVFKELILYNTLTVSALASLMGCSSAKARKVLHGLVAKGVANIESYHPYVFYKLAVRIPPFHTLKTFSPISKMEKGEPKEGVIIRPNVSLETVKELIELLRQGKGYIGRRMGLG